MTATDGESNARPVSDDAGEDRPASDDADDDRTASDDVEAERPASDDGDDDRTASDGTGGETGDEEAVDAHLADVPDGCGCAEIWEHLSERRADDD